MIIIERPGPLTTVQDLGRPGLAHLGVGRSGAADRASLTLANRLVGNDEGAACLEITLGGLVARFERAATVALTGAAAVVRLDGIEQAMSAPLAVRAGATLALGVPAHGIRTYLAVRGGLDVPPVLGSRSTDLLAGLGPDPVRPGTRIPVGNTLLPYPGVDVAAVAGPPRDPVLRIYAGPRDDWFGAEALAVLCTQPYEVSPASDRVGLRLTGPPLARSRSEELPSEGMVEGALQVPPDGEPVLFLADHPVTGGYPVIAVVEPADIPIAAQSRPGDRLRFQLSRL
ncbi:MAG: biotin-dependent carboxyltransferase family protein [Nostocoides sp.]